MVKSIVPCKHTTMSAVPWFLVLLQTLVLCSAESSIGLDSSGNLIFQDEGIAVSLKGVVAELASLRGNVTLLQQQLDTANQALRDSQALLLSQGSTISQLASDLSSLRSNTQAILASTQSSIQTNLTILQCAVATQSEAISQLRTDLDLLKSNQSILQDILIQQTSNISWLQAYTETSSWYTAANISYLQAEVFGLQAGWENLTAAVALLQSANGTLFERAVTVQELTNALYHNITTLEANISQHSNSLPKLTLNQAVFTQSGTYTPPAGLSYVIVECVGGGGGGANAPATGSNQVAGGSGGGSGGYARKTIKASDIGSSQPVTVGLGGSPNSDGGQSRFGSFITCMGGQYGYSIGPAYGGANAGGNGGAASGGDINIVGSAGQSVSISGGSATGGVCGGSGGPSYFGGASMTNANVGGSNGLAYGAGGAGGSRPSNANSVAQGGKGAGGVVIVTEYILTQ
eukprot:m.91834 g.91834  ORF g.91834 m.91834 type:complete len:461 (-) comp15311_c0_seq4:492-1874(-)